MSFEPTEVSTQPDGLTVYTFYLECLAHASYVIAHEGVCFVVDPRRDIGIYTNCFNQYDLKLKGCLESHLHADFVSGHLELHKRYGTTIFIGDKAGAKFPHYPVADGEELILSSKYSLKAIATPGHTFGCVTWCVLNRKTGEAVKAFTGDTLFVGGNGRPDLVGALIKDATPQKLSAAMYNSLYHKLAKLPGSCQVLPAHGPGSPCGKGISSDLSSTIEKELKTNPAFQFTNEEDFTVWNTTGLDEAPQYFSNAVLTNMMGAEDTSIELSSIKHVNLDDFKAELAKPDTYLLDTRDAKDFAAGHIKGSINIPIGHGGGVHLEYEDGNFAIWVGTLIPPKANVLIVSQAGQEEESIDRLGRIGYAAQIVGVLDGGMAAWRDAGNELDSFEKVVLTSPDDVKKLQEAGNVFLDARTDGEFHCVVRGHVVDAVNVPLNVIESKINTLDASKKYIAYCLGGFRSAIATSILRKHGINAVDVQGGYDKGILPVACQVTTCHPDACAAKKVVAV